MIRWGWERWSTVAAVVVGLIAVFGDPYGGRVVKLDTRELASIVQDEVDHVVAEELADWIVQGQMDFRLLDLRDEAAYAEYHVPGAERVPISELVDYPLLRNEKIVLYSGGGIHSAQAWFLLRAHGYRGVYMLLGGLDAWKDDVLFPGPPEVGGEASPAFARAAEVSRFFGGTPRSTVAGGVEDVARAMPTVEAPTSTPRVVPRKKKRKEGC